MLVNVADDFRDQHATTFNQMIPQPQRGIFTADEKAVALCCVIMRSLGLLRTQEDS